MSADTTMAPEHAKLLADIRALVEYVDENEMWVFLDGIEDPHARIAAQDAWKRISAAVSS